MKLKEPRKSILTQKKVEFLVGAKYANPFPLPTLLALKTGPLTKLRLVSRSGLAVRR